MRLPPKKQPGDPILAKDWNALLEAVSARTPRSGLGLDLVSSSGGFAYSSPPPTIRPFAGLPPFAVIGIEKGEAPEGEAAQSYLVTIREGWVIERMPKAVEAPAVKFHVPLSGETALDAIPRPQISMEVGDTAWCKYATDEEGEITGTPEIIIAAADQNGAHYQPEDPLGSGVLGEYFVKLFKLEDDAGKPRVKVFQQSDIEHYAQLWTGRNIGGGEEVFKEHREDLNRYDFRTLAQRASQPQVTVEEDGDVVRIQGNSKNLNARFIESGDSSGDELKFADGLSTDGTVDANPSTNKDIILPKYIEKKVGGVTVGGIKVTAVGGGAVRLYELSLDSGDNLKLERNLWEYNGTDFTKSTAAETWSYWIGGLYAGTYLSTDDPDAPAAWAGIAGADKKVVKYSLLDTTS